MCFDSYASYALVLPLSLFHPWSPPHFRLTQQLDLKQHALGLLEDRMAGSESAQLAATVDQVWGKGEGVQEE